MINSQRNRLALGLYLALTAAACPSSRAPLPGPAPEAPPCPDGVTCFDYGAAIEARAEGETRMAAARFYRLACDSGEYRGCNALAVVVADTQGNAGLRRAATLFSDACANDVPAACANRALLLDRGFADSPATPAAARTLEEQACERGSALACRNLGSAYAEGHGVSVDPRRAEVLWDLACAANDTLACARLGDMLLRRGEEPGRLHAYLRRACMGEQRSACVALGAALEHGAGATADPVRAAALFGHACARGSAAGCRGLGRALLSGSANGLDVEGIEQALTETCDETPAACAGLADLLITDEDTPVDGRQIATLLNRACDAGDALACGRLGEMLLIGVVVPAAPDAGRSALARACRGGFSELCDDCAVATTCTLEAEPVTDDDAVPSLRQIATAWRETCDGATCVPATWLESPHVPAADRWGRSKRFHVRACEAGRLASCARAAPEVVMAVSEERCDIGDINHCLLVAEMHGETSGKNAVAFYERACELGHARSCARAGAWNAGDTGKPTLHGIELLRRGCELGDASACDILDEFELAP